MAGTDESCPEGWQLQRRPLAWIRRFDFADYEQTRRFLDHLAEISAGSGYYPSLNFARTHVVVTVQFDGDADDQTVRDFALAAGECAQRAQDGGHYDNATDRPI